VKNFKTGCELAVKAAQSQEGGVHQAAWSKKSSKLNHFEMIKMFDLNKMFPLTSLSLFGKRDMVNISTIGKSWHC